jgi:hypothetical protein
MENYDGAQGLGYFSTWTVLRRPALGDFLVTLRL